MTNNIDHLSNCSFVPSFLLPTNSKNEKLYSVKNRREEQTEETQSIDDSQSASVFYTYLLSLLNF